MPGGGWFSYTLRQLTFNPRHFNSLSRYTVQSICTFVTQCVQQPFELGLLGTIRLERHPRYLKTNTSFKSPLKGLLVVVDSLIKQINHSEGARLTWWISMKFLLQILLAFSLAFVCPSLVFAANWNTKKVNKNSTNHLLPSTKTTKKTLNIFIPKDVLEAFNTAPESIKINRCGANSLEYKILSGFLISPPKRVSGFNSRMDNVRSVEGAMVAERYFELLNILMLDAWIRNDPEKKQIVLEALHSWASAGALTETSDCSKLGSKCTQWTRKDGQDNSLLMDHNYVLKMVSRAAYGYYLTLVEHQPNDPKHAVIQNWINSFLIRMEPFKGFGLDFGWRIPSILIDFQKGNLETVTKTLEILISELEETVRDDGSFYKRTTRGNRALWYHSQAMAEALVVSEMARNFGLETSQEFRKKIQKAADLFLRGWHDHGYMDQWAKEGVNSVYTPGEQDIDKSLDTSHSNSWLYIYPYLFPETETAKILINFVKNYPNSGRKEPLFGIGLGCIYSVARDARYPAKGVEALPESKFVSGIRLDENHDTLTKKLLPVKPIEFIEAKSKLIFETDTFVTFKISLKRAKKSVSEPLFRDFRVLIDFDSRARKQGGEFRQLRLLLPSEPLLDKEKLRDALTCDEASIRVKDNRLDQYWLFSGPHEDKNECVLKSMSKVGREESEGLLNALSKIFSEETVRQSDPYGIFQKHSEFLKAREKLRPVLN